MTRDEFKAHIAQTIEDSIRLAGTGFTFFSSIVLAPLGNPRSLLRISS
jgi:hypothetical protein